MPTFDIVRLGFVDPDHTTSEGSRSSTFKQLSETGYVIGTSQRYGGGGYGETAWLYDGVNTINIGLTDVEHTLDIGLGFSNPTEVNEAGQVAGTSLRFNGGNKTLGLSAWLYDGAATINISPSGAEHSRLDGYRYSKPIALDEAGRVAGHASRFNGTNSDLGQSVWLYDGTNTAIVGLTGPEYTRLDGYKTSTALHLTEAGHVVGLSTPYNGTNIRGQSVWYYNGTTTTDIGLNGPEFAKTNGYRVSEFSEVNSAGHVVGHSDRYDGVDPVGRCAWLYDGTTTDILGFTGAGYIRDDGFMNTSVGLSSSASPLNEAGQVVGRSFRFSGAVSLGPSAWIYDGASTIQIGLTGTEHTASDGYRASAPRLLNEAGDVAGVSLRYQGAAEVGESAWLYDGTTTIDVGLTGAEHTRNDGYKSAFSDLLNEAGDVVGFANRYHGGSAYLGDSAWLYNGTSTIDIGLTDAEHTRNDGYKDSYALKLNEAGQVAGRSQRYNGGSTDLGMSAWFYNGASTINIGLSGAEYTDFWGYKSSEVTDMNEAGQVVGHSEIYDTGNIFIGQNAWLYDPVLDQTFSLRLSTAENGAALSDIKYFGEDGLVLGTYHSFEDGESHAFYFTVDDGLHDLGSLVAGGLEANGWDALVTSVRANGLGQIVGSGRLTNELGPDSSMAYLLVPVASSPGDFNGDGTVDAVDYTVWRDGLGSTYTSDDYDIWKSRFGQVAPGGGAVGAGPLSRSVPEISVTAMFAVIVPLSVLTRRSLRI